MNQLEKDMKLEQIMIDHGDELVRVAFSYVRDEATAKDMVQNTFIKCYQNLDKFRGEAKIKTWLYRIVINECKDYLKSWYYRKVHMKSLLDETLRGILPSVEKAVINSSECAELNGLIFSLPKKYREVIYLYYYESLKVEEIADIIDISINTVKTRLRRGKQKLEITLRECGIHER